MAEYTGDILQAGQPQLDTEYIWDANAPGRLACRIRQLPGGGEQRLYPLYDVQGNVVAVVGDDGEVQERYRYDVQGNIEYLDANFAVKGAPSLSVAWQHLFGGMRRDDETGLYFGGGYYHAKLGRFLPSGKISVFGEGYLNSRAAGFPFGTPQPAGAGCLMEAIKGGRTLCYLRVAIGRSLHLRRSVSRGATDLRFVGFVQVDSEGGFDAF